MKVKNMSVTKQHIPGFTSEAKANSTPNTSKGTYKHVLVPKIHKPNYLSNNDLKALLQNFDTLEPIEQQVFIACVKFMEAWDPGRLKPMVPYVRPETSRQNPKDALKKLNNVMKSTGCFANNKIHQNTHSTFWNNIAKLLVSVPLKNAIAQANCTSAPSNSTSALANSTSTITKVSGTTAPVNNTSQPDIIILGECVPRKPSWKSLPLTLETNSGTGNTSPLNPPKKGSRMTLLATPDLDDKTLMSFIKDYKSFIPRWKKQLCSHIERIYMEDPVRLRRLKLMAETHPQKHNLHFNTLLSDVIKSIQGQQEIEKLLKTVGNFDNIKVNNYAKANRNKKNPTFNVNIIKSQQQNTVSNMCAVSVQNSSTVIKEQVIVAQQQIKFNVNTFNQSSNNSISGNDLNAFF